LEKKKKKKLYNIEKYLKNIMCFKCGKLDNDLFVPKKKKSKKRQQREKGVSVSLSALPDDAFLLVFLYAGIQAPGCVSQCSVGCNTRFSKDDNEKFWEDLCSHTAVVYQSSVFHRACFPEGFSLCDDDICQLMPLTETPTTWKDYFATAVLKFHWLIKIQNNCTTLQNISTKTPADLWPSRDGVFSVHDIILIRHHSGESALFQSLYDYDHLEVLRLRAQSRLVHTAASGCCIVEELQYTHDLPSADVLTATPAVSLCVLSAMTGSICWGDVIECVVENHLLGESPPPNCVIKVESVYRREMPFEVYYLDFEYN
jgi:hypothetical protein